MTVSAKTFLSSIGSLGKNWLAKKSEENAPSAPIDNSGSGSGDNKILGMHPMTFGIAATVLGLAVIGGLYFFNKRGGASTTTVAGV